jgi:hypothetical protein
MGNSLSCCLNDVISRLYLHFETLAFGTELFGPLLLTEEILKEPLRYENFELHLPTHPYVHEITWETPYPVALTT